MAATLVATALANADGRVLVVCPVVGVGAILFEGVGSTALVAGTGTAAEGTRVVAAVSVVIVGVIGVEAAVVVVFAGSVEVFTFVEGARVVSAVVVAVVVSSRVTASELVDVDNFSLFSSTTTMNSMS